MWLDLVSKTRLGRVQEDKAARCGVQAVRRSEDEGRRRRRREGGAMEEDGPPGRCESGGGGGGGGCRETEQGKGKKRLRGSTTQAIPPSVDTHPVP
jgi:hypothetical protein